MNKGITDQEIVEALKKVRDSDRRWKDIANDYGITEGYLYQLSRKAGITRKKRFDNLHDWGWIKQQLSK